MTDTWTWATVTQASPLRIKVDGDTSALDATTGDLVGSLAVDDRVRVHLHSDGILVTGIQGGGNRSNPNLLINSNFMVNQRGAASGASLSSGDYFLDRWMARAANAHYTWTTTPHGQPVTLGVDGGAYSMIRQTVERQNVPADDYTLSWEGGAILRVYNAGGTAPTFTGNETSPITVTLDGTDDVRVEAFGTGESVGKVKLERGTVATPHTLQRYDEELAACQRYYWRSRNVSSNEALAFGMAAGSTTLRAIFHAPVEMRAQPTLTAAALNINDYASNRAVTSATISGVYSGTQTFQVEAATTGLTAYRPGILQKSGADSYLAFDAEM